jgi:glycosyltransferase involved in cell wall biosynthesis
VSVTQISSFVEKRDAASASLVSVVIPTHNRAALLARAITSVLAQTYTALEVLVVDDASTDHTRQVVMQFDDPRLLYIRHERNRGGAATRNTGIDAASGEYIAFLDDDDEWEPDKTAEQLKLLQRYPAVLCGYHGEERGAARRYQDNPTVKLEELRRGFFRGGGTSALMARADILRRVRFDESLPCYQDWDLCIRLAQLGEIGYVQRPLLRYNDGDHQRISNRAPPASPIELERELCMLHKHKALFGRRFGLHASALLLRDIKRCANKWDYLRYGIRHYGIAALTWAIANRVYAKVLLR